MENASKALLIAGAVLIVILLIGVGMMIYNGATGSINSAVSQMSAQDKQIFNQQFEQYEGTINGTKVKSLLTAVMTNNSQNEDDETKQVVIQYGDVKDAQTIRGSIQASKKYTVSLTYGDGIITTITIADA